MKAELPFLPETAAEDAGDTLHIAGDGLGENVNACICISAITLSELGRWGLRARESVSEVIALKSGR